MQSPNLLMWWDVSETVRGIKIYETVSYHNNEIDYSEIENSPKIIHFLVLDRVYSIFTISQQHFILVNAIYKLGPNNLVKFEDLGRISLGNMTLWVGPIFFWLYCIYTYLYVISFFQTNLQRYPWQSACWSSCRTRSRTLRGWGTLDRQKAYMYRTIRVYKYLTGKS